MEVIEIISRYVKIQKNLKIDKSHTKVISHNFVELKSGNNDMNEKIKMFLHFCNFAEAICAEISIRL